MILELRTIMSKRAPSKTKSTVEAKKTEVPKKRSSKKSKVEVEEKKTVSKKEKTSAPLPIPMVNKAVGIVKRLRKGRGFSIPELSKIGLEPKKARKMGFRVDYRRSTELTHNVDALKKIVVKTKKTDVKKKNKVKKAVSKQKNSK